MVELGQEIGEGLDHVFLNLMKHWLINMPSNSAKFVNDNFCFFAF